MVVFQALSLDFLKRNFPRLYESLHVNILRGQLNLLDVDIPPTDPFTIFSYPFCVSSGSIESLTLHIPWTHITTSPVRLTARNVRINLREPSQMSQQSVFIAFMRAAAEQKKRSISPGENNVSPLIRAVRKLVPLVLHRFELDLHDIQLTICFANNCVASLTLGALVTRASQVLAADLAKSFVIENFSFEISAPPNRPLSIYLSRVELDLALANTRYDVRLSFPDSIPLNVNASLAVLIQNLSARRRCWQLAFACDRPNCVVSEDPSSWIRYAFRVALHLCGHSPVLTERHAVVIMRKCIRYEHLHSLRLTRRLSSSDLAELEDLELELDSDMISLLSARAETKVLADQASSFAASDWFRWTVFGSQVGAKRDAVAAEVRRAVFTSDNPDLEMPSFIRANVWSRARLCLHFEEMRLIFSGGSHDFHCHATGVVMRAEAESNLDSFSVSASVAEIITFTDGFCSFYPLPHGNCMSNVAIGSENLIEILIDKPALADRVNVAVRLQPVSVTINLPLVREGLLFLDAMLLCPKNSNRYLFQRRPGRGDFRVRGDLLAKDTKRDMDLSMEASRLDILIVDIPSSYEAPFRFQGLRVSLINSSCRNELSGAHFKLHGFFRIEATACRLELSSARSDKREKRLSYHEIDALRVSADLTVGLTKNCFSVQVEGFKLTSNISKLDPIVALVGVVVTASKEVRRLRNNFLEITAELSNESAATSGDVLECHLVFSVMFVEVLHSANNVQGTLTFRATLLSLTDKRDSLFGALRDAHFSESVGKGRWDITPAVGLKEALFFKVIKPESTVFDFDALVGNITISTSASSLMSVRRALSPIPALTASWRVAVETSNSVNTSAEARGPRITVAIQKVQVELGVPLNLVVHLNHLSFISVEPVLSGSCDRIRVVDRENSSGCFITEVSRPIESRVSTEQRMLSFNNRPGHVNIHLSSTQFTLSRSFCSRLNILFETISYLIAEKGISEATPESCLPFSASSSDQLTTSITARGSNLSIEISEEPEFGNAIRLDVPEATSVFSAASRVLSIRKVSMLTRISHNYEAVILKASPARNVARVNWKVLLRNLDADISYHSSPQGTILSSPLHHKATLSVTLLSRMVVLLAPNQVRTLATVLTQSFNIDADNPTITRDEMRPQTGFPNSLESMTLNASSERCPKSTFVTVFRCETHALSFELLDENRDGSVASTVALIELDPVLVTLKKVWDTTKSNVPTIVTQWRATCPSFRLEDRGVDTPISRQVVIETEESWIGIHGFASQMLHHEDMGMGVSVEGIIRTHDGVTTRSHQIHFKHSRVLLSSRLYGSIVRLYNQCVIPAEKVTTSLGVEDANLQEIEAAISINAPASKLSISFHEPVILLLSTGAGMGDSMFQIRAISITGTFLFSKDGYLLPGSVVKVEQGQLFITWVPDLKHEKRKHVDLSSNSDDDKEDFRIVREKNQYDLYITSASRSNLSMRSVNRAFLQTATESVLEIGSVSIGLPVGTERHYTVVISDVIANLSLLTLKNTVRLATGLDIGTSEDRDVPVVCPELRIAIKSFFGNVKMPNTVRSSDVVNGIALHIHISGNFVIAEDVCFISGATKVAIDVNDDRQNVADHLILPLILSFKLRIFDQFCIELATERFTRLTISPLTARALTGIVILLREPEPQTLDDDLKRFSHVEYSGRKGFQVFPETNVHVTFKGIIIYCLAEDPRIQILRLVFREVKMNLIFPGRAHGQGSIDFSLGDFLVEDTISWSLPWRVDDLPDPVRWSKLIIGNRGGVNRSDLDVHSHIQDDTNSPSTTSLIRSSVSDLPDSLNGDICTEASPSVICRVKWVSSWEHVTVQIHSEDLEVNVDLALFSSVCEWVRSVSNSIDLSMALYSNSMPHNESKMVNIGIDHFVLDSLKISLSVRAPPRRLHETAHVWVLNSFLCSETVEKMNIRFPQVVFNGDFPDTHRVFDMVGDVYMRTLTSTCFLRQMLWQFPSCVELTRVMLALHLRQRNQVLVNRVESPALSNRAERGISGIQGLSSILSDENSLKGVFRRIRGPSSSVSCLSRPNCERIVTPQREV